jgi:hypothetical protein
VSGVVSAEGMQVGLSVMLPGAGLSLHAQQTHLGAGDPGDVLAAVTAELAATLAGAMQAARPVTGAAVAHSHPHPDAPDPNNGC